MYVMLSVSEASPTHKNAIALCSSTNCMEQHARLYRAAGSEREEGKRARTV